MGNSGTHRAAMIALAVVAMLSGCQSGRIDVSQVSDDGWVLAFQDERYETIYVADREHVRRVSRKAGFALSPYGDLLAVFRRRHNKEMDFAYVTGDELRLLELRTGKKYRTKLCFNIPSNLVLDPYNRFVRDTDKVKDEAELQKLPRVHVYFHNSDSTIMIGPIWDEYWRWNYGHDDWVRLSYEEAGALIDVSPSRAVSSNDTGVDADAICIPSDGLTALHTVWVRPDGSTMELLRKNDAPALISFGVVLTLISPIVMPITFSLLIEPPVERVALLLLGPFEAPLFVAVWTWPSLLTDLEVDREAVIRAREAVHIAIAIRRHGPQRAPEPLPPADE